MSLEGVLRDSNEIEVAVADRLNARLDAYLAAVERQRDLAVGVISRPRGIFAASEIDKWSENQLPAIIVATPGTTGTPEKGGDGYYRATYQLEIAAIVSTSGDGSSRRLAQRYAAAIRPTILQERSLDTGLAAMSFQGETLDAIDIDDRRTLFGSVSLFEVTLEQIVNVRKGPLPEDRDDPGTVNVADTVTVEIDNQEITP